MNTQPPEFFEQLKGTKDRARFENALDILLNWLLKSFDTKVQGEVKAPAVPNATQSTEEELVSGADLSPRRSRSASKSARRKRRPPPDLNS